MLHLKVKNDFPKDNLNDFMIIEDYFDRNIRLRLNGGVNENELKEAQDISTIITKIISILNRKYNGSIPPNGILDGRKMIAKFLGLALFKVGPECLMKFGPNCGGITGPCCSKHRLEGLIEAHELFPKLFEPFGVKFDKIDSSSDTFFTSLLAIYVDFKTQIIVSDLILNSVNVESLSHRLENLLETFYGPAMNLGYLKTKLQQRAVDLRRILEQDEELKTVLESKFPADLFENNLKNILRNVYNSYPKTLLSEKLNENEQQSEPVVVKVAKPVKERERVLPESESEFEAVTEPKAEAVTERESEAVRSVKLETNTTHVNPSSTKVSNYSSTNNPFKNVIISGKFFRGILEPVDERFAAIIEGRDVNVKQYLLQRQKWAMSIPATKKAKTERVSLFDRHDSAERISWDTQEPIEFKESENKPEIVNTNNTTVNGHNVIKNDNSHNVSRPLSKKYQKPKMPSTRGRRKFSDKEVANLIEGVRRFGRDWRRILTNYEFDDRSNVDLKDKARNLEKLGLL